MTQVFGKDLSGMLVVREDGSQVGELHNIQIDPQTGGLKPMLVDASRSPAGEKPDGFPKGRSGYHEVPAEAVIAVKDYIVISQ
jgi:sporulation protein YlmC with PRC-barrel domain